MENSNLNSSDFSSHMQIGSSKYEIINNNDISITSKISIDKILENISYLKEKSDNLIQNIIDNNKFLLQQEKISKKNDEDVMENFIEEI